MQLEPLRAGALAAVGGKDYPSLLREWITGPLGMADTGVAPGSDAIG